MYSLGNWVLPPTKMYANASWLGWRGHVHWMAESLPTFSYYYYNGDFCWCICTIGIHFCGRGETEIYVVMKA